MRAGALLARAAPRPNPPRAQMPKLLPQPHDSSALGLENWKPPPMSCAGTRQGGTEARGVEIPVRGACAARPSSHHARAHLVRIVEFHAVEKHERLWVDHAVHVLVELHLGVILVHILGLFQVHDVRHSAAPAGPNCADRQEEVSAREKKPGVWSPCDGCAPPMRRISLPSSDFARMPSSCASARSEKVMIFDSSATAASASSRTGRPLRSAAAARVTGRGGVTSWKPAASGASIATMATRRCIALVTRRPRSPVSDEVVISLRSGHARLWRRVLSWCWMQRLSTFHRCFRCFGNG